MAGLLDDEELMPFFGNPNIQRQGARARALAAKRDVNTLPDPRTYAAISGLLGQAPDEMGFSVLNPDYEGIQRVARPAFAAGTALGIAPMMRGMNLAPRPAVRAPSAASQRGSVRALGELSPFPQEEALKLAQQRAALPIEQGGLGLPKDNTPMDRARAMGYPMELYMSRHRPIGYLNTLPKPNTPLKNAEKIKAELEQLGIPVQGEQAGTGSTYLTFPGNVYKNNPAYGGGAWIPIEQMRFATHSKRVNRIPINEPDDSFIADVFPKYGHSLNEARTAIQSMIEKDGIRSRFAAFDPFRRTAAIAATMGVAAPDLMARTIDDEERRRQLLPGLLSD